MTPFPTQEEIAKFQAEARLAWEKSREVEGLERMRYINAAFPFAVTGGSCSGLHFSWHSEHQCFTVADAAGFITLIEKDDITTMLIALGMEAARRGSFRELIEGEERRKESKMTSPPLHPVSIPKKVPKGKLSLADIGLGGKKDD